ncbi:MAG: hypothetical protein EB060_01495 [Proteobacteria bacterium]|nr:hypothetical protein [Pseudomonadota bacterium]
MDGIVIPNNNLNQTNNTIATAAVKAAQTQQGAQGTTRVQVAPAQSPNSATINDKSREQEGEINTVERRMQLMKRLANLYAVSDSRFTIYKDKDGVYHTRITNLRDGTVTVVPEPDLYAQLGSHHNGSLLTTSV